MAVEFLDTSLRELTTIRVGGGADRIIRVTTEPELVELVSECSHLASPTLIVGGGSNVVCSDQYFPGTVIVVATTGIEWGESTVRVSAGENWDSFVQQAVERGYGAFTPLSGIPGSVGATPIQNIGAYGMEIADVIHRVTVLDRETLYQMELEPADCDFGYRTSVFKRTPQRYVVLGVTFTLLPTTVIDVVYPQLAEIMGVAVGDTVDAQAVRQSVLALRGAKSMVLDSADADSNSTGSFFINPTVPHNMAPEGCPSYALKAHDPRVSTHVKLSAAWLIEQAGITKGFRLGESDVRVSANHSLAIANTHSGTAAQVLELAGHMRQRVFDAWGIELEVEPVLLNCSVSELVR